MSGKRSAIHPLLRREHVPRPWMRRRRLGVVSQAAIGVNLTRTRSERTRMVYPRNGDVRGRSPRQEDVS